MPTFSPRRLAALLGLAAIVGAATAAYLTAGLTGLVGVVLGLQVASMLGGAFAFYHLQKAGAQTGQRSGRSQARAEEILRELTALTEDVANVSQQVLSLRAPIDRNRRDTETLIARHHRRTQQQVDVTYRQLEALGALYNDVQPQLSFPPLRGWAMSPDFLHYLYRFVLERRPRQVLDCGSGISTVVVAYALQRVGRGRVVALEHAAEYHAASVALVHAHGLAEQAEVRLAPLTPTTIDAEPWEWYDRDQLPEGALDLVIVDGPPAGTRPLARYPALPLLWDRLATPSTVMLDDLVRDDEQEIVRRWRERFPNLTFEERPHEKVTGELHIG